MAAMVQILRLCFTRNGKKNNKHTTPPPNFFGPAQNQRANPTLNLGIFAVAFSPFGKYNRAREFSRNHQEGVGLAWKATVEVADLIPA